MTAFDESRFAHLHVHTEYSLYPIRPAEFGGSFNVTYADELAATINFIGRCIKYVNEISNFTEVSRNGQLRGSEDVHKNAVSRYDGSGTAKVGRGDYLDSVTRDKILSIDQYDPLNLAGRSTV